jgi:flagellar biosynthetic protein FliP
VVAAAAFVVAAFLFFSPLAAQQSDETAKPQASGEAVNETDTPQEWVENWTGREGLSSTLKIMLLLSVVSMAPAFLLMTTSFIRVVVVLGLLRQALGTQQLPPTQVITALAMFLSLLIMTPVWRQVYDDAVAPYNEGQIDLDEAWRRGQIPVRKFMAAQIERTGNTDDVYLFLDYIDPPPEDDDAADLRPTYVYAEADEHRGEQDVPLQALLPAFMLSELKTAFIIGFQIYLPFVILDLVVAAVMSSMGMVMLPPVLVSLPFKLLLFVLVDGWHLVVEMLLMSFQS